MGKVWVKERMDVFVDKNIQDGGYCRTLSWDDNVGATQVGGAHDGALLCDTWGMG